MPETFELFAPYPNPFNNALTVHFSLPRSSEVRVRLCNILGQRVMEESWGEQQAGYHRRIFKVSGIASGVYFVEMAAGKEIRRTKVVLLK